MKKGHYMKNMTFFDSNVNNCIVVVFNSTCIRGSMKWFVY